MHYLSGGLFHENKSPVKLTCPDRLNKKTQVAKENTPWLLVFYYLTDAFVLVLFTSSTSHPHLLCRSSRLQMFFKLSALKNFVNFTGKHLCWSLFLIKLQAWNFVKKRLQHRCFPVKFAKVLRTPVLKNTSGGYFYLCCFSSMFRLLLLLCRTSTASSQ